MRLFNDYQKFVLDNSESISTIERFLRSVSYIIPGRFADSEVTAELLYSLLNLLRLVHETCLVKNGAGIRGQGIQRNAWNAYIAMLRRQSKTVDRLITLLNITWTMEVPTEMLIQRFLGLNAKVTYVLCLELTKFVMRVLVFWQSGWRPVLRNYFPNLLLSDSDSYSSNGGNVSEELLSEIKLSEGKEEAGIRNFIRKNRISVYSLVPELTVPPLICFKDKARELAHLFRPLSHAILLAATYKRPTGDRMKWALWIIPLFFDGFAEWPHLKRLLPPFSNQPLHKTVTEQSDVAADEKHIRLIKLLLYLLRNPFYQHLTRPYLNSIIESLSKWRLLKPVAQTAKSYQSLCERVEYYTLGS